jgi:AraC-like DNA-binding protein
MPRWSPPGAMLNLKQVQQRLHTGYYTTVNLIRSGKLVGVRPDKSCNTWRFPAASVNALAEERARRRRLKQPARPRRPMAEIEEEDRQAAIANVTRALDYMHAHYCESNICVDAIAAHVSLSKYHLSRLFLRVTGVTICRRLTQMRMARAAELLTTTKMYVDVVRASVGLSSTGTFCTTFRQYMGFSPSEYRDRFREEKMLTQAPAPAAELIAEAKTAQWQGEEELWRAQVAELLRALGYTEGADSLHRWEGDERDGVQAEVLTLLSRLAGELQERDEHIAERAKAVGGVNAGLAKVAKLLKSLDGVIAGSRDLSNSIDYHVLKDAVDALRTELVATRKALR